MKLFYKKHRRLCISSLIGFLFTAISGTLLHFAYEWTGRNFIAGLISPVNESTWEHMKLIYFPLLIYFCAEYIFLCKSYTHLLRADLTGMLPGTLLMPVIFYTYTGIIGTHYLTLDILTFLICAAIAFYMRALSLLAQRHRRGTFFCFVCVLVLGVCFLIFTYYPPHISLFISP